MRCFLHGGGPLSDDIASSVDSRMNRVVLFTAALCQVIFILPLISIALLDITPIYKVKTPDRENKGASGSRCALKATFIAQVVNFPDLG